MISRPGSRAWEKKKLGLFSGKKQAGRIYYNLQVSEEFLGSAGEVLAVATEDRIRKGT